MSQLKRKFSLKNKQRSPKDAKSSLQSFIIRVTLLYIYLCASMTPEAEKFNGWAAMIGFIAAVGAYATTGQIIPGIF